MTVYSTEVEIGGKSCFLKIMDFKPQNVIEALDFYVNNCRHPLISEVIGYGDTMNPSKLYTALRLTKQGLNLLCADKMPGKDYSVIIVITPSEATSDSLLKDFRSVTKIKEGATPVEEIEENVKNDLELYKIMNFDAIYLFDI